MKDITEKIEVELKNNTKLWQTTLDAIKESIFLIDLDHKILQSNRATLDILGKYNYSEIIGHSCWELVHDTSGPIEWCPVKLMLESGHREDTIRQLNGRWVEISADPVFNDEGEITGSVHVISDITTRKQAEDALTESEKKYKNLSNELEAIFDIVPATIFRKNRKGEYTTVNQGYADIFNLNKEDMIGKTAFNFFSREQAEVFHNNDLKVMTSGQPQMNYDIIAEFQGDKKWLTMSKLPQFREDGEVIGLIGIAVDMSEIIKREEKLRDSEERFRTLFEIAPASIIFSDLNGNIILYNKKFCDLHAVKNPELLEGKNIRDFFKEKELPRLKEAIKRSSEGIPRGHIKYTMLKEDGTEFLVEAISSGIKNKNGKIIGLIGVAQEITERKNAEQKLKESEEMFRIITEQAFMGILIIQDDKVEYVNDALLQIFEYALEEINNWSKNDLIKLIHPEDLQFLREYRQKLRAGDPKVKPYYSYRVFTKSGKLKWIDQFSKPIIFRGKPAELVTIMDITEKKEAEQELIKLNSLKSELLRRTSHELKTPLVSIKGYSDLLLNVHKEKLDDYVLASIVEIKQGCERLESLIQDILNTAELESGAVQLKKKEEDLSFLIKLSIRELQGLANLRNHTINLKIHDKLVTSFEPEQIHRVITNLINNAIKYTPPDGIIEIKSEIRDNVIILSVKDSGIGITREEKERLFAQFGKIERYGQGLDIISDGSGLGLYISKKVIELHGGKIWVESEGRNKGSTFYFSLPLIRENSGGIIP